MATCQYSCIKRCTVSVACSKLSCFSTKQSACICHVTENMRSGCRQRKLADYNDLSWIHGLFFSIFFHHKILQERYRCSQKYESFLSTHMFILWLFYSSVCLPAAEFWNSLSLSYRLISVNLGRPSNATIYTEWIWLNAFRSVSWIKPI